MVQATGNTTVSKTRVPTVKWEGLVCLSCLFRAVGGVTKLEEEARGTNILNAVLYRMERRSGT